MTRKENMKGGKVRKEEIKEPVKESKENTRGNNERQMRDWGDTELLIMSSFMVENK